MRSIREARLAAMRPPMVPSPTNPTTTLFLDIASPSLQFSDFRSASYRLARTAHIAEGAAYAKGEMRDDLGGHGGQHPLFSAEPISAWLRCRRAVLSPVCLRVGGTFPGAKGACTRRLRSGADFGG